MAVTPADAALNPPRRAYAGLFALSAGALLFQVTFVRIFSAAIWYHFAFLVVSVALFGIGASGVAMAIADRRSATSGSRASAMLWAAPLLFALTAIGAHLGASVIPFSPFRILQQPAQVLWFLLDDLLLALPFFFFGSTVARVLGRWPERAGRLYAFDLAGAALGTLLVFVALPALGARGAIALSAALGAIAAWLMAPPGRARMLSGGVALLHLPLLLWPALLPDVRLDDSKPVVQEVRDRGGRLASTTWSPLARVDVVDRPNASPMIFLDAGAATPIAPPRTAATALADVSALPYALRRGGSVVVIGSGGGIDVQNALALDAARITAVEINPVIIDLVTHRYGETVAYAFANPRVTLVRDEGRSWMARSRARQDVIQITLIDTWAASASGAYSLSENYLYTVEAMSTFLDHLAPHGLLAITRWYYEAPRLVSLIRAALERRGVREPSRHVMVIEERLRSLVLVSPEPLTDADVVAARAFVAADPQRQLQHDPLAPSDTSFFGAFLGTRDPRSFYTATDFALAPVSDDSPFFFQMTRWSRVRLGALRHFTGRGFLEPLAIPVAQIVLLTALALAVVLSAGLLAVPLLAGAAPPAQRWRWLAYFLALGVAYIAVEVVLMQRLALLLGHPTYSVTLVLFAILLFSGLGAGWVDRRPAGPGLAMPLLGALLVSIGFVAVVLPRLVPLWLPLALPARAGAALLVIAPLAFVMGMPFPLAVRRLGGRAPGIIAWGWAANGCGSVIGSVAAVLGAMLVNFSAVLLGAGAVYALAMVLLAQDPPRQTSER